MSHYKESLLALGILFVVISIVPSTLVADRADIGAGTYQGYVFQCVDNPILVVTEYNTQFISIYIMTLNESYRWIEGVPIQDISSVFMLVNISQFSGVVNLGAPGVFVAFITTFNQSRRVRYDFALYRAVPHLTVLVCGLCILTVDIVVFFLPSLRSNRIQIR